MFESKDLTPGKILLSSVGKHEQPDELIDCKIFDLYYLPKFDI